MASDAMTKSFSISFAEDLANDFNNDKKNQYFLYFGKVDSWTNSPYSSGDDNTPASNVDSIEKNNYALRDSVTAKRISSRNIYRMIPRNDWVYGTYYSEYDHTLNMNAAGATAFYVHTTIGNVYKCIGNAGGLASQYEPDHTSTPVVSTNDGYRWLFMGKVLEDALNFVTENYIPVSVVVDSTIENSLNQWNAQQAAIEGSIDYIKVTPTSSGFTAAQWTRASVSATNSEMTDNEVRMSSSIGSTYISLDISESAESDYYKGYSIYITSGPGIGQKRLITSYDASDRRVNFTTALTSAVEKGQGGSPGSRYQILPNIVINGDGSSAEAIPLLGSSYQITGITVIGVGKDYTIADAEFWPKGVSGGNIGTDKIQGPTLECIIPPMGGHASNIINELDGSKLMILTTLQGTNTHFPSGNNFRQLSIIKNPKLNGGTNDGNIAGSEISKLKQLTVEQPYYMTNAFNDTAFVAGNSVVGETSKATGKIESWNADANGNVGTINLSNVQGTFDIEDPSSKLTRIIFTSTSSGSTGNFTVGNIVKQTTSNGVGKIKSWNSPSSGPYELIIDVTSNSFNTTDMITEYDSTGTSPTSISWQTATVVEKKKGELIKTFSSEPGTTFEWKPFGLYQGVARANRLVDVQDADLLEKTYRMTTNLIITDSGGGLSDSSYTLDDTLYQHTLDSGITAGTVTGKIASWSATNGNTGELYLNDVRGSFVVGGFSGSANHTITTISEPEILVGSGEVLYIQNIRPVTRSIEQDEEVKIMIGF